jgi:hypothetical protein
MGGKEMERLERLSISQLSSSVSDFSKIHIEFRQKQPVAVRAEEKILQKCLKTGCDRAVGNPNLHVQRDRDRFLKIYHSLRKPNRQGLKAMPIDNDAIALADVALHGSRPNSRTPSRPVIYVLLK